MTRFSHFYVFAIGAFILAGAHYVRNGADGYYVLWVFTAVVLTLIGQILNNPSKAT